MAMRKRSMRRGRNGGALIETTLITMSMFAAMSRSTRGLSGSGRESTVRRGMISTRRQNLSSTRSATVSKLRCRVAIADGTTQSISFPSRKRRQRALETAMTIALSLTRCQCRMTQSSAAPTRSHPQFGGFMSDAEKPAVLLVDDNEATCTLITAILHRDFRVETVMDGMEAIEKLRTTHYAVLLLDLRMTQFDGFSVLDFLKANQPDMLPNVLIVTAVLTRKETDRAKAYGVCGIVTKPFDVEKLLEMVKQCAGGTDDGGSLGNVFCSSTPMILLIADLLRNRMSF